MRLSDFTSVPSASRISKSGLKSPGELPTSGPGAGAWTVGVEDDRASAALEAPQAMAAAAANAASAARVEILDNR